MTSNVILQFSTHLKPQRLETITVFLRLNGQLPTSDLGTLQTQPCYNRTHTNSVQQIAVAITEDRAVTTAIQSVFRFGHSQRPPVTRTGSKYVKQSAVDNRQGIITELRGRPDDCLRHCACYKIQNWQDFGKTKATDMEDGTSEISAEQVH